MWKLNREPSHEGAVIFSMGAVSELCKRRANASLVAFLLKQMSLKDKIPTT